MPEIPKNPESSKETTAAVKNSIADKMLDALRAGRIKSAPLIQEGAIMNLQKQRGNAIYLVFENINAQTSASDLAAATEVRILTVDPLKPDGPWSGGIPLDTGLTLRDAVQNEGDLQAVVRNGVESNVKMYEDSIVQGKKAIDQYRAAHPEAGTNDPELKGLVDGLMRDFAGKQAASEFLYAQKEQKKPSTGGPLIASR